MLRREYLMVSLRRSRRLQRRRSEQRAFYVGPKRAGVSYFLAAARWWGNERVSRRLDFGSNASFSGAPRPSKRPGDPVEMAEAISPSDKQPVKLLRSSESADSNPLAAVTSWQGLHPAGQTVWW